MEQYIAFIVKSETRIQVSVDKTGVAQGISVIIESPLHKDLSSIGDAICRAIEHLDGKNEDI